MHSICELRCCAIPPLLLCRTFPFSYIETDSKLCEFFMIYFRLAKLRSKSPLAWTFEWKRQTKSNNVLCATAQKINRLSVETTKPSNDEKMIVLFTLHGHLKIKIYVAKRAQC